MPKIFDSILVSLGSSRVFRSVGPWCEKLGVMFIPKWGGERHGGPITLIRGSASKYFTSFPITCVFHRGPFPSFWLWTCLNSAMLGIFIAAGQSVGRLYTSMASYRGALEEVIKSFFLQQWHILLLYLAFSPNLGNLLAGIITIKRRLSQSTDAIVKV